MYLISVLLPGLSSLWTGIFGRKIGVSGASVVSTTLMFTCLFSCVLLCYEVLICQSPVHLLVLPWMQSDFLDVNFAFHFDQVSIIIILVVSLISSLVHIYSVWYMAHDPHMQRFLSYLSAFTFFMIVLVSADSYLLMFVGWEGIGVLSFLLINFWTTRIQASKAAIQAITVNRIGDMFLSIGFFVCLWAFTNLDYVTTFSLAPYINTSILTLVGILFLLAASGKSAQIGLHVWLVNAMEGFKRNRQTIIIYSGSMVCMHFNINTLEIDILYSTLPAILLTVDREKLEVMTGNILGDGSIRSPKKDGTVAPRARYCITMKAAYEPYIRFLRDNTYRSFGASELKPYPNLSLAQHEHKQVLHYTFYTRTSAFFGASHALWYRWSPEQQKYIKIIPFCIAEIFSDRSLAYWIIDDGYFDSHGRTQTIILCTESFTKKECEMLIVLLAGLGIVSTLKVRNPHIGTYRIRVSKKSIPVLREKVLPYIHPVFIYKLGLGPSLNFAISWNTLKLQILNQRLSDNLVDINGQSAGNSIALLRNLRDYTQST